MNFILWKSVWECVCAWDWECVRERERERVCVCMCMRKCVWVRMWEWETVEPRISLIFFSPIFYQTPFFNRIFQNPNHWKFHFCKKLKKTIDFSKKKPANHQIIMKNHKKKIKTLWKIPNFDIWARIGSHLCSMIVPPPQHSPHLCHPPHSGIPHCFLMSTLKEWTSWLGKKN